jgi:hypothetical protein
MIRTSYKYLHHPYLNHNSGFGEKGAGDGSVGLFDMRTGGSIARLPLSSSWEVSYMPSLLEELWIWILVVSVELKGKKKYVFFVYWRFYINH